MRRTPLLILAAVLLSLALAAPASAQSLNEKIVKDYSDDGALDVCKYTDAEVKRIKSLIGNDIDAYDPGVREAVESLYEKRAQGACDKASPQSGDGSGGSAGSGAAGAPGGSSGGSGSSPAGGSQAPTAPGVAKPAPAPGAPQTAAPLIADDAIPATLRTADEGGTPPAPLLALAALLALLALGAIVLSVVRFTGWEPAWVPAARHATAEAGWRASSTWAEFTDFVRLGR